ncbi:MAG: IclR family transcriptional regulator [Nitrospirae bacterium]|nr:IclR family transcriptional regulator [Nitrospirota bacterium]
MAKTRKRPHAKRQKADYRIQAITHALDLLEAFSPAHRELGVTQLSQRLGLDKNNIFRILATLELRGYIEQNRATGDYRLGLRTFELGQTFQQSLDLLEQARPFLEQLVVRCDETAYLGVLRGARAVYLDVVETPQAVRAVSRLGAVIPACCTAIGKAQLAFLPQDQLRKIFDKEKMAVYTDSTIRSREALFRQLEKVASRGYALGDGEYEDGVRGIGAPIRNYTQQVVAGVSISGPAHRLSEDRLRKDLAPLLLRTAREISLRLGWKEER